MDGASSYPFQNSRCTGHDALDQVYGHWATGPALRPALIVVLGDLVHHKAGCAVGVAHQAAGGVAGGQAHERHKGEKDWCLGHLTSPKDAASHRGRPLGTEIGDQTP